MRILLSVFALLTMISSAHADVYLTVMSWGGGGNGGPIFQYTRIEQNTHTEAVVECKALAKFTTDILSRNYQPLVGENKPKVACIETILTKNNTVVVQEVQ